MRYFVCTTPEQVRLAQSLRYEVYCEEKGWVDATHANERCEIDEYDHLAVHLLAVDANGQAVGTARFLLGWVQELPVSKHVDLESLGLLPRDVVEVSRLATRPGSRSQDLVVFLGLARLIWHWGMENSVKSWCAIADVPLYHLLTRLRLPELAVAQTVDYLGSKCVPAAYDMLGTGAAVYRRFDEPVSPVALHHELRSTVELGPRHAS